MKNAYITEKKCRGVKVFSRIVDERIVYVIYPGVELVPEGCMSRKLEIGEIVMDEQRNEMAVEDLYITMDAKLPYQMIFEKD